MPTADRGRGGFAIEVEDLRRTHRTTTETLGRHREVEAGPRGSLHVAKGDLFGLLGPNAAGKTTTIQGLCHLLRPPSGRVRGGGPDVVRSAREVRRRLGTGSEVTAG